jgi:hypothetical protein
MISMCNRSQNLFLLSETWYPLTNISPTSALLLPCFIYTFSIINLLRDVLQTHWFLQMPSLNPPCRYQCCYVVFISCKKLMSTFISHIVNNGVNTCRVLKILPALLPTWCLENQLPGWLLGKAIQEQKLSLHFL